MENLLYWKKASAELNEEERTQKIHKRVRQVRKNPEALDDLPIELFLRLVGIYYTIPKASRENPENESTCREFLLLREFIDGQLATDDGKNFAKYEMSDYVHNLYLLLIAVVEIEYLEANIHNIREEYRGHIGESNYKLYLQSNPYEFLLKYKAADPNAESTRNLKASYEEKLRSDYGNLINEIRRSKLYEQHIEDTRAFLMGKVFKVFSFLITIPSLYVIYYLIHFQKSVCESKDLFFIAFSGVVLVSVSAIAGATGSLISVLLRIQGVRDNNQLAQNLVAFKYSKVAVELAPFTGMIFAMLLCFILYGGFVSGTVFPKVSGSWTDVLCQNSELSKLIVWCFIAGFSERLIPDMVDRISDKARKADEK